MSVDINMIIDLNAFYTLLSTLSFFLVTLLKFGNKQNSCVAKAFVCLVIKNNHIFDAMFYFYN